MANTRSRPHFNGLLNPRHVPDDISRTRLKSSFPLAHFCSFPNSPSNSPLWPPGSLRSLSHLRRLFCTVHALVSRHFTPNWLVWLRHHHFLQASTAGSPASNSDSLKNTFGRSRPQENLPQEVYGRLVHVFVLRATFRTPPAAQAANVSRAETL